MKVVQLKPILDSTSLCAGNELQLMPQRGFKIVKLSTFTAKFAGYPYLPAMSQALLDAQNPG